MKFTITCDMKDRWAPHFLGLLKRMQVNGSMGCSRTLSFFADGDGDFRPKFEWENNLPEPAPPLTEKHVNPSVSTGDAFWDAG